MVPQDLQCYVMKSGGAWFGIGGWVAGQRGGGGQQDEKTMITAAFITKQQQQQQQRHPDAPSSTWADTFQNESSTSIHSSDV